MSAVDWAADETLSRTDTLERFNALEPAVGRAVSYEAHVAAVESWPQHQRMLLDWFTTGLEGGIGYWSVCTGYRWIVTDPADAYAEITVTEDGGRTFTIRLADLDKAMNAIALDPTSHGCGVQLKMRLWNLITALGRGEKWLDLDEFSDFDADDADQVFQVACLGTVVYA